MSAFATYLPVNARSQCLDLVQNHPVTIRVVNPRRTKHGDFRKFPDGRFQITLNKMENPYRFLITFIHEWAHWLVIQTQPFRTQPHGAYGSKRLSNKCFLFFKIKFFLNDLLGLLAKHMKNPKSTLDADPPLALALKRYDPANDKSFIFELETGTRFQANNGKIYELGQLRRTRYACVELATKRTYLFAAHSEVQTV